MKVISSILPPCDIEDVVQEAYVKAFQMMQRKEINYPKAYMCTIAKNLAYDKLKKAKLTVSADEDFNEFNEFQLEDGRNDVYKQVCVEQSLETVSEAMRLLPNKCNRVLILKKVYGYTNKEIAKELEVSIKTVESHMTTGLKRFDAYMTCLESRTTRAENASTENQGLSS